MGYRPRAKRETCRHQPEPVTLTTGETVAHICGLCLDKCDPSPIPPRGPGS